MNAAKNGKFRSTIHSTQKSFILLPNVVVFAR